MSCGPWGCGHLFCDLITLVSGIELRQFVQFPNSGCFFFVMSWMLRTWHSGRPILFLNVCVGMSAHACCAGENLYFQRALPPISPIVFAPACPALYQTQDIQGQYYERHNHLCSTNERISLIDCYTSSQFNVVSEEACT